MKNKKRLSTRAKPNKTDYSLLKKEDQKGEIKRNKKIKSFSKLKH